jgi:hypothetical protein
MLISASASLRYISVTLFAAPVLNLSTVFAETGRIPCYVGSESCKKCHESEYKNFTTYAKKSTSFRSIERVKK